MQISDGERLYIYRTMGGWTQKEFGFSFDCHQTYIAAMERDDRPVRDDIAHFSEKLPRSIPDHIMMAILRKRKGYPKHMLSGLTGIDARKIGEMERGKMPIDPRIERLLDI